MKNCYICKQSLPFDQFYLDKSQSSGYSSSCRECGKKRRVAYAAKNKAKETARRVAWAKANPERQAAIKARYKYEMTPEQREAHQAVCRQYKKDRPDAVRRYTSKRRAVEKNAVVDWEVELTEFAFAEACHLAVIREQILGTPWQVDHIIPLRGKIVSGLHVWNNFQVLTKIAN